MKTAHITLIEDNPADILLIRKALQGRGMTVELTCFEDGDEALKSLALQGQHEPDLILLDLNLPMTEGVEVLRGIRAIPGLSDVPVAILSSSASPGDVHRTQVLGVTRYISKPIALDDFLREVGRAVEEILVKDQ